jgi:hypothetical protein
MNRAGVFEILWVKKNYKAFKKWIFCANRFPTVPVITADDDCLYFVNFAELLYQYHKKNKAAICTFDAFNLCNRCKTYPNGSALIRGAATLYCDKNFSNAVLNALEAGIASVTIQDDNVYDAVAAIQNILVKRVNNTLADILCFHDANDALGDIYGKN